MSEIYLKRKTSYIPLSCRLFLLSCALWISVAESYSADMSFETLAGRMTDRASLARLPEPGESSGQFSSYNRKSQYDAASGQYIDWNYNHDGNGVVGKDGEKLILAEISGPGCIYRIWSAAPKTGNIEFVIDGESVLSIPFANLFQGKLFSFSQNNLAYIVTPTMRAGTPAAGGNNFYAPIAFQKSCRILADKDYGVHYLINYVKFKPDTVLLPFRGSYSAAEQEVLAKTDSELGRDWTTDFPAANISVELLPGMEKEIFSKNGKGALEGLAFDLPVMKNRAEAALLRGVILEIRWKDADRPAVSAPLGDFFGSAPGLNPYRTFFTAVSNRRLLCHWFMPYFEGCSIVLRNETESPVSLQGRILESSKTPESGMGTFHALWHQGDPAKRTADRAYDISFLDTAGRGRFAGVFLHIWNPVPAWWGEGDEKFYVDGEKSPSTFGTGTEDYLGYAWCQPGTFAKPFHAMSFNFKNRQVGAMRWQLAENVPFQKRFFGTFEAPDYYPFDHSHSRYNEIQALKKDSIWSFMPVWYMSSGSWDLPAMPNVVARQKCAAAFPNASKSTLPCKDFPQKGVFLAPITEHDGQTNIQPVQQNGRQVWAFSTSSKDKTAPRFVSFRLSEEDAKRLRGHPLTMKIVYFDADGLFPAELTYDAEDNPEFSDPLLQGPWKLMADFSVTDRKEWRMVEARADDALFQHRQNGNDIRLNLRGIPSDKTFYLAGIWIESGE